jgi:hypothetical protein
MSVATTSVHPTWHVLADYWGLGPGHETVPDTVTRDIGPVARHEAICATVPAYRSRPPAFVKIFDDPALFARELDGLSRARAITTGARRIKVPDLLWAVEAKHAVVTQLIQAEPLDACLQRCYLALPDWYLATFSSLGEWLATYHRARTDTTRHQSVLEHHVAKIGALLETCGPDLGAPWLSAAYDVLTRAQANLADRPRVLIQCHGDLSLGNLLLRDGYVYVVDFAYSGPSYPELDLMILRASLLASLGHRPFSRSARARLWSAFVRGYGLEAWTRRDRDVSDLLELHLLAFNLAKLGRPPSTASALARLRQRYKRNFMRRTLRRWLAERTTTRPRDRRSACD